MNWEQARSLLRRTGHRDRTADERRPRGPLAASPFEGRAAGSVCVASGKGGTGKSVVSASLGALLAHRGRTLIVDADLGVGNAHILQDVAPEHSLVDVVEGRKCVAEVVAPCGPRLDLVAAGSGVSHMATLSAYELSAVAAGLARLEREYEHLIVDSAAGISGQTLAFAAASDVVLLVTTPDLTAMTDAYAFLKALLQRRPGAEPLLVVNRARDHAEAEHVAERMHHVARKFLGFLPRWVGTLPEDELVSRSVNHRRPVVVDAPHGPASQALRALAHVVLDELGRRRGAGLGHTLAGEGDRSARVV